MEKVIPILPCPDVRKQAEFYQALGFTVSGIYTSPNPYVALRRGDMDVHFYGSRRMVPIENPSMCFLQVDDVDACCAQFTAGIRQLLGQTPRAGIPRISKVRDLKSDRRFTLVDPGGNTIFVGTPVSEGTENFFRTLESEKSAQDFTILYDLLHSKEDAKIAANMLPRLLAVKEDLSEIDRAKLLLVAVEIRRALGEGEESEELNQLLAAHAGEEAWERIRRRLDDI